MTVLQWFLSSFGQVFTGRRASSFIRLVHPRLVAAAHRSTGCRKKTGKDDKRYNFSMKDETLIVGLSGVSSSGKTTLARLLRDIFPNSFILHEDDFYWPDDQIPIKHGIQDWDCSAAIDISKLVLTLNFLKRHGHPPPEFTSKEDQNSVGKCDIDLALLNKLREQASSSTLKDRRICLIDGFLLYPQEFSEVRRLLDVKLFLHTDYGTAKTRRQARSGYVTVDGFWQDPPGYFDNVVWSNYVQDHSFLFRNGSLESDYDEQVCRELGLSPVPPTIQNNMTEVLQWAFRTITNRSGVPG